jgi:hypothetical protein
MEMKHIFLTASYLLENEIQDLNEAVSKQIVDSIKAAVPQDLTNAIAQAKNDGHILSILKGYTKDKIGREAASIPDAVKIINTNPHQEITSITNMLIRAANYPKDKLGDMTAIEKKRELTKLAERKGIDVKGKTTKEILTGLHNKIESSKQNPNASTITSGTSGRDVNKQEQTTEPFPGKRDLFIASYKRTLQLGWPGEDIKIKGEKQEIGPDGKPIKNVAAESPVSGKLIPLNVGAKTGTKLTEFNPAKVVNKNWIKLAETLVFNKFKNNPNGLRKLSQAVDDIIEKNKNFKLSRRVNARNLFASIGSAFIQRFGGTESDVAMFNWLVKKAVGMDIFEFQKMIIDKVLSTIDVSDDRITKMEKTATGIKKMMEGDARFTVSPLKSFQGWNSYEVSYNIKSNIKPINTPTNLVSPLKFYLETMLAYIKSPSSKTWTETPSAEDVQNEILKIAEYTKANSKTQYEYTEGEEGKLSFVQEDTSNGKLVGTQYMYPTFLGKDGLRITVKYIPEIGE